MKKSIWENLIVCPGAYYDPNAEKRKRDFLKNFDNNARLLDLGSGDQKLHDRAICLDIKPFTNVNVVGDAHFLPFKDNSFDGVVSFGVLEHTRRPWNIIKEVYRVTKKERTVFIGVPFIQGYHPAPGTTEDMYRFTTEGLDYLCESVGRFTRIESGIGGGPASAAAWILREFLLSFIPNFWVLKTLFYSIFGCLTFWIKYFDYFLMKSSQNHKIYSSAYFIGKK